MIRLAGVHRTYRVGSREVHALRGIDLDVGDRGVGMLRDRRAPGWVQGSGSSPGFSTAPSPFLGRRW